MYDDINASSTLIIDEPIRSASIIYTIHTCKDNHVWGSKFPEESEIVALKADIGQSKSISAVGLKNDEKYESTISSGNTNVFNKSRKTKLKEDIDFITITKVHQR